eukprot:TRINITY_DN38057_c0_g1_i1.p1 TRINITY_DN38057_c0_g1~~TRINITY_DN38057_c0_g1_i1.p1  ORF type:complete len:304 (-),score=19.32 TRINITY_DN38057_c0_g1_i1:1372-2283(-)
MKQQFWSTQFFSTLTLFLLPSIQCLPECQTKHPRCIFVAAVGLSGSTTLMDVLNQHPEVHLRGENNGLFNRFMSLMEQTSWNVDYEQALSEQNWDRIQHSSSLTKDDGFMAITQFFKQLYAHDQDRSKIVGFKEIRFWSTKQLDFVSQLCDDSKFVFQFTNDTSQIKGRMWYANMKDAEKDIITKIKLFADYHEEHPENTFISTIQDFRDPNYVQRLFDFLGLSLEGVNIDIERVYRVKYGSKKTKDKRDQTKKQRYEEFDRNREGRKRQHSRNHTRPTQIPKEAAEKVPDNMTGALTAQETF